jgi:5-phospho-D-xylono-1,4-lactonase
VKDESTVVKIETTLGALEPAQLGWINAHEHVIMDSGLTIVKEPDFKLDSVEKAVEEVGYWKAAGGGALVDCQPFGCGRNVDKLLTVSETTSVPIIVATGFQQKAFYLSDHWIFRYSADEMAELLIAECLEGVDRNNYESPIVKRSHVKAGFIKIAADYQHLSSTARRQIEAAGHAHAATKRPILVHTDMGTASDLVLDALEAANVPLNRVMLCHMDRNPDVRVHEQAAKRGAYLQYDTPGRIKYQPETVVIKLMREMLELGLGAKLLLGGDTARRAYWKAYGGGPGLDYLLATFTPRLRQEGFDEAELKQIWHSNPLGWLSGHIQKS